MPSFQEESASISQPQAVQEREQVNDSLCALLDPLINRRSITEPRVNYRDVVDAIEQGATINVRCADGASPLHFAAAAHGLMVVELLISQEADVHAAARRRDQCLGRYRTHPARGWSCIQPARRSRSHSTPRRGARGASLIRVLLEHGADPSATDPDGRTALHIAARHNPLSAVSELLLNAGADPAVRDRQGSTPCHVPGDHLSDPEVRQRICTGGSRDRIHQYSIVNPSATSPTPLATSSCAPNRGYARHARESTIRHWALWRRAVRHPYAAAVRPVRRAGRSGRA